jgi:hypothetical protein
MFLPADELPSWPAALSRVTPGAGIAAGSQKKARQNLPGLS